MKDIHQYLLNNIHLLKNRDMLLDLFCEVEFPTVDTEGNITTESPLYEGKLIKSDNSLRGLRQWENKKDFEYKVIELDPHEIPLPTEEQPTLVVPIETIVLPKNSLSNIQEETTSTFGRLFTNYLLFVDPFGDIFPYWNAPWSMKKLSTLVANAALEKKVTVDQLDVYIQNLYFFGHSPELAAPNYSRKSLSTDPSMEEKRRELINLHKEAIENNNPIVMSQIEDALIEIDKNYLKGDVSMDFYGRTAEKSFGIHRKKMYMTNGMTEEFGDKGSFNFVENPLKKGWEKKDFAVICNDIRKGIYERAMETAKGGEESKFIGRVFQNTRITMVDCETQRTLKTYIDPNREDEYLFRNIRLKDGTIETLTKENIQKYIGQTVDLRSPMYCEANPGYCKICMGKLFEELDQDSLTMVTLEIGSYFLKLSLKGFHGSKLSTFDIDSLNPYVI